MLIEGGYNGALKAVAVDAEGRVITTTEGGGGGVLSATVTRVAASATSVTLLAANATRRGVIVHNDSNADLWLKFGATASATSYTVKLGPGDLYESPSSPVYPGIIHGIWSAADGAAQITEL